MSDSVKAATQGVSGQARADRRYSYEADNNPQGLFVTLSVDVAKEFTFRGAIMEFTTSVDNLEPAVWPSGGYTVQGRWHSISAMERPAVQHAAPSVARWVPRWPIG